MNIIRSRTGPGPTRGTQTKDCQMQRRWALLLTVALLMTLMSADFAFAKRSRSSHRSSRAHVKQDSRGRRGGRELSRTRRGSRERYASRRRRGRHVARRSRGSYEAPVAAPASASSRPSSGIPTERVTEIQSALIKAGYLDGPASGQYDDATIAAMKQFQADNGFSQTGLPSAALLKKLGVPKRPNDGYAVSVTKAASESEKKRPQE